MAPFPFAIMSPVVDLFVREGLKPIKKHFGYCLKPESNVRKLSKAAEDLKENIDIVKEKVKLGELEGRRPRVQATRWIDDSAQFIQDEPYRIKNMYDGRSKHIFGCSWNFFFNHRISSVATKKKAVGDELKESTPKNDNIFSLLPPVGRELPLPPNIMGQNRYMKEIVACIKQGTTSFIGICGMGGAGKTTLIKQLNNIFSSAAETHEFDCIIYVEIGQQQDLDMVQQNVASQLGLVIEKDESTTFRSASLYNFLKERKFLLLMDDLWQTLDLVQIGIPQGCRLIGPQNRQMIVITTRLQHVCHRMQVHGQVIMLQRLEFEEAWNLFDANAGCNRLTNSSAQIRVYAKSIVNMCGGLPLALKIVGQAMASKESEHEWNHAMLLLRRSQFHKVPDAESNLYSVLYISYENLPDERTKQCFLFFVLAGYDNYNYVPYAINLWMGHGFLDEDDDIRNSYVTGHAVVGCLKRACLLEEHPRGENYVRMHDIIRGLALWIVAMQQGDGCNKKWQVRLCGEPMEPEEWNTAHRISLTGMNAVKIPDSCSCIGLLTLSVPRSKIIGNVPTGFFRTAPYLTYLDLSRTNIQELPSDVGALVNLQHLDLSLTQIRAIGMELKLLKSLRYLYLGHTRRLKTISDGTISSLTMLRVLDLYNSGLFSVDKTQAYVEELESLVWLQSLGFTVADSESLHRILNLSNTSSLKYLNLQGVQSLQFLHISPSLIGKMRAHQLEKLYFSGMKSLKELLIGETIVDSDWHFQSLDDLVFADLHKLESIIWKGVVPHVCLPTLRFLVIVGCHSIKTLTWIKDLPCLKELYLIDCNSMLELVADDEVEENISTGASSFPRLKLLGLSQLGHMQSICGGTLSFPCLQRLLVYKCPMLVKFPSGLLTEERVPLILGRQDWWEQLCWEDSSVESAFFQFFRELPANFRGNFVDVGNALVM